MPTSLQRTSLQRVDKVLRLAEVGGDLKKMPALHLARKRNRVDTPVNQIADERPERFDIIGHDPLVKTQLLERGAARLERVGSALFRSP